MVSPKILVVDNHKEIRQLVRFSLKGIDHAFLESGDSDSALNLIKIHNPDLIILDVMLSSNSDGLELLQTIKAAESTKSQVIMISARAQADDIDRARALNCDAYLTKPFDRQQLIDKVHQCLATARK